VHPQVLNCRKAGIKPVVVGAMDAESLEACRAFGVRSFSMEHSISSFGWGAQIGVIEGLMELGYARSLFQPPPHTHTPGSMREVSREQRACAHVSPPPLPRG
jgi:hypothetical protein